MSGINDSQTLATRVSATPTPITSQPTAAPVAPAATPTPIPTSPYAPEHVAIPAQRGVRSQLGLPAAAPKLPAPAGELPSYHATFGKESYVKDGRNPAFLKLMSRAIAADPQLAKGPLGQGVQRGDVGPQEVRALQHYLQSKGFSVGHTGVDGKFGPNTHAALAAWLKGRPAATAIAPQTHPAAVPVPKPRPVNAPTAAPAKGNPPASPTAPAAAAPSHVTPNNHTAVYDVSAHTVYLPDGTKLEAHSGLGANRDNPASESIRNRGTTPQALYKLSVRQGLFHGVEALRLTPISGKMFGRDGILAHTYMLRRPGDSNGCVVFRNYPAFLHAYLSGQINEIQVVAHR